MLPIYFYQIQQNVLALIEANQHVFERDFTTKSSLPAVTIQHTNDVTDYPEKSDEVANTQSNSNAATVSKLRNRPSSFYSKSSHGNEGNKSARGKSNGMATARASGKGQKTKSPPRTPQKESVTVTVTRESLQDSANNEEETTRSKRLGKHTTRAL